jgi:hypothetical protein
MKKKVSWKFWVFLMIVLVLIGAIYFTFFFTYSCDKYECLVKNLEECKRAKLLYENQDTTWFYQIKGKQGSRCEVDVTLLQIKRGKLEIEKLQGDSMTCLMPLGVTQSPEKDISLCTGKLKEGLQELIIQRLHNYILANLGQIQSELEGIPELSSVQTQTNSTNTNSTSVVGSNSTVK